MCKSYEISEERAANVQKASRNVRMTPCDDTANSTRWCCGENKDCCAGDIGVETLAQTFLGDFASATLSLSSSATTHASSTTAIQSTSPSGSPVLSNTEESSALSSGAIAGIVIGALVLVGLVGAAWFFFARRRKSRKLPPPIYIEEGHPTEVSKTSYAYEADGGEPNVSEVPATNVKDQNGKTKVHELQ